MSRSIARIASVTALAVVAALFATTAFADNRNGKDNGNSANAPGQVKQATPVAQSSTAPGIKPSNSTQHSTKCTTGGGTGTSATCKSSNPNTTNADASKRYGNGKTAAQIANSHGAPAGTTLSGPGNSQPHKVAVCPSKTNKSGGKDVHAVKSYPTCPSAQTTSPAVAVSSSTSPQASSSPLVVSENTAATTSAQSVAAPASSPGAEAGVLGAIKALRSPSSHHANAGILGKLSPLRVLGGTLPFSGFPLWAAMLVALALLTVGLAVRRRAAATH
ncbi:MAG TPA: hypothetical protein VFM96_12980 [Gaiellaceae bacterium]|nr:hypothetical protein [Gaiellaceae bacterium]